MAEYTTPTEPAALDADLVERIRDHRYSDEWVGMAVRSSLERSKLRQIGWCCVSGAHPMRLHNGTDCGRCVPVWVEETT